MEDNEGAYRGHRTFFTGCSYNCPRLDLYGFRNELQLKRAIDRTLRRILKGT